MVKEQNSCPWIAVFLIVLGPVTSMNEYLRLCLQVFSYLVACDHLCRLGYHMAQVEEALEMFQNCETKVRAPFLLFQKTIALSSPIFGQRKNFLLWVS